MKNHKRLTGLALMLCVAGLGTGCRGVTMYAGTIDGGGIKAGLASVDKMDAEKPIDWSLQVDGFDASLTLRPMEALRDLGEGIKEVIAWSKTLAGPPASLAMGASLPAKGG